MLQRTTDYATTPKIEASSTQCNNYSSIIANNGSGIIRTILLRIQVQRTAVAVPGYQVFDIGIVGIIPLELSYRGPGIRYKVSALTCNATLTRFHDYRTTEGSGEAKLLFGRDSPKITLSICYVRTYVTGLTADARAQS